jgi:hypothetical protein
MVVSRCRVRHCFDRSAWLRETRMPYKSVSPDDPTLAQLTSVTPTSAHVQLADYVYNSRLPAGHIFK